MKKFERHGSLFTISLLVCCMFLFSACGVKAPVNTEANEYSQQLKEVVNTPIVAVNDGPYLGATLIPYTRDYTQHPIFSSPSSLNMHGTLADLASTITYMTDISVQLAPDAQVMEPITHTVDFEGKILALLDYISNLYGVGWEYESKTNMIVFSRMQVRTFPILTAPGTLRHSAEMSSDGGGDSSSEGGSSGESGSDSMTSEVSQSLNTNYNVDVWADLERGIAALLSPEGTLTVNRSTSSVTIKDNVPMMRQITNYIDDVNQTMLKQVALSVKVWTIELSDSTDVSVNLSLLFSDSFKLASGTPGLTGVIDNALTATIVDGSLRDSSATLKALNTLGQASQVTSGSGIIMNNQPLPVQNVKQQTYLSSVSSYSPSTGGNTTALKPSTITYGFAMTVIPNILDRRRCIIQYNVSLSALDRLEEVSSGDNTIQLPTVSTRSFNQRAFMNMGQTLVLAGFEQESDRDETSAGLLSFGKTKAKSKSLIVITITLQSMNN